VNKFKSENVSVMFLHAAEAVHYRRPEKHDALKKEQQYSERCPIPRTINLAANAPDIEKPVQEPIASVHRKKQKRGQEQEAIAKMIENEVAGFMGKDEERFLGRHFLDNGVINHDSLGGPKTGNIGIESIRLRAGVHEEHALTRD